MILHVIEAIVGWFILMYLSTNILGFLVRGLFLDPEIEKLRIEGTGFIKDLAEKDRRADKWINLIALIFLIGFVYALIHFWNYGVLLAAVMVMAGRLPDLLWEIKHGRRLDPKLLPKNATYWITTLLTLGSLPVFWYFF